MIHKPCRGTDKGEEQHHHGKSFERHGGWSDAAWSKILAASMSICMQSWRRQDMVAAGIRFGVCFDTTEMLHSRCYCTCCSLTSDQTYGNWVFHSYLHCAMVPHIRFPRYIVEGTTSMDISMASSPFVLHWLGHVKVNMSRLKVIGWCHWLRETLNFSEKAE